MELSGYIRYLQGAWFECKVQVSEWGKPSCLVPLPAPCSPLPDIEPDEKTAGINAPNEEKTT